jgi:dipeptidyl aminopeptidase/acylaminoacyl peptidase
MRYFNLFSIACLLSIGLHAEANSPEKNQPEMQPLFSSAPSLKKNISCYRGPFANYDTWLAFMAKNPKFNSEVFTKRFPKNVVEQRQNNLECFIFVYESDGHLVEGVMVRPKNLETSTRKLPVVIYNRGGNAAGGTLVYGAVQANLMPIAGHGYIVIASQYRGAVAHPSASGIKQHFELDQFGGADVNDVKNLLPIIEGMKDADASRLGMVGSSRGGMMSYLAARDLPQLKALIVEAGVTDLAASLVVRKDMEIIYKKFIPDYDNDKAAQLTARSVLFWQDKLPAKLPILLMHGDKDVRVELAQSVNFAKALEAKKHPHKLVIYPGDDHGLDLHRKEADAEIQAWLKQYL